MPRYLVHQHPRHKNPPWKPTVHGSPDCHRGERGTQVNNQWFEDNTRPGEQTPKEVTTWAQQGDTKLSSMANTIVSWTLKILNCQCSYSEKAAGLLNTTY